MTNSNKNLNEYPNMSEDYTNYYELIVARANVYKKTSRLEAKGLLMIFGAGVILALPNIIAIDFLSFIRSVLLCVLAVFIPIMHVLLANRKKLLKGYITKPDFDGLLNMLSNKKSNKIVSSISNMVFCGTLAYASYLMWITPFLLIVNYLACMITVYSSIGIWAITLGKTQSNKKMLQEVLAEEGMLMKDLFDDVETWVLKEAE